MTSESALSRWSRLKQEHANGLAIDSSSAEPDATGENPSDVDVATDAMQTINPPAAPAFDLASLPPIQSITAGTDIRSFLGSGVPVELTRAALRRAWVTDPTIRGFIGIAESQWDFNDPAAMPGFGPLRAGDDISSLLAQALGKAKDAFETTVEADGVAPVMALDPIHAQRNGSDDKLQRESDVSTTSVARAGIPCPVAKRDANISSTCGAVDMLGDPATDGTEG